MRSPLPHPQTSVKGTIRHCLDCLIYWPGSTASGGLQSCGESNARDGMREDISVRNSEREAAWLGTRASRRRRTAGNDKRTIGWAPPHRSSMAPIGKMRVDGVLIARTQSG